MNQHRLLAELTALRSRIDLLMQEAQSEGNAPEPTPWMKVREYAVYASVGPETVRRWVHLGMPHVGAGKLVRINRDEADKWRSEVRSSGARIRAGSS